AATVRIPLDATNFESIVNDAKDKADEAYANANIATQNAMDAIDHAQEGFDKAQQAITDASNADNKAEQAITKAQEGFDKAQEALDDLDTIHEFVDDTTGEITTIKGSVQGLQASVSSKVDQSTYNTFVQQTNNSIAGKISMTDAEGVFVKGTTFSATIDGLQTTVSNKADKSTVTQLAGVVDTKISTTDANNKFATQSQLTQTSNSLTSTITSVRNDLDGLEIGGANLNRDSNNFSEDVVYTYDGANITEHVENVSVEEWGATDATQIRAHEGDGTSLLKVLKNITYDTTTVEGETYTVS